MEAVIIDDQRKQYHEFVLRHNHIRDELQHLKEDHPEYTRQKLADEKKAKEKTLFFLWQAIHKVQDKVADNL